MLHISDRFPETIGIISVFTSVIKLYISGLKPALSPHPVMKMVPSCLDGSQKPHPQVEGGQFSDDQPPLSDSRNMAVPCISGNCVLSNMIGLCLQCCFLINEGNPVNRA